MAINLTTKFSDKVAERLKHKSYTEGMANHDYEFTGIKTLKIYSIDTAPMNDYNRSGANRYGNPEELGDTLMELTMTQDKSFTFTIDKGNAGEQMNIKSATRAIKRQTDEKITPMLDKYRFDVWTHKAGNIVGLSAAPTAKDIVSKIMDATEALNDLAAPDNRVIYIPTAYYKLLKQNPDFISVDKLGEQALAKGHVGYVDGMKVVEVPKSYLPENVYFFVGCKKALLAPVKLQEYKVHRDPPGISGDLAEGRIIHDAFVLGTAAPALYVAAAASAVVEAPAATVKDGAVTLSCATSGAVIKYTLDGSEPRYAASAKVYIAAVTPATGETLKAYAEKDGMFNSEVCSA